MSKYPLILLYRHDKYNSVDSILEKNKQKLNFSYKIITEEKDLNLLFDNNHMLLITYGDTYQEYFSKLIPERMYKRWIHYKDELNIDTINRSINYCYISNCYMDRIKVRPIYSAFTTTYNSYKKIYRAYNSLKNQSLNDWEWVILDDSPDDLHFIFLKNVFKDDNRIRLYKRSENSGNIGNVKNEAVSLCRGNYVLELDHDDEITPDLLEYTSKYFNENTDVGFIYTDFINIYENGNNFHYSDFISKGYGAYYTQKFLDKWVYVYITPNINNITLSHLTCCPNHPRIWRRSVLLEIGNYSEFLPICDDFEILLRTALNTKIAKFPKIGYVQYMNDGGNNFSLIRNAEINRIGPYFISPIYFEEFKINDKMKELGGYEDEKYIHNYSQLWKRGNDYEHKYCNKIVNLDYDMQYCIIGIDSLIYNIDNIRKLYENNRNDFILLDNKSNINYLWFKLEFYKLDRFKCYTFVDNTEDELINYFKLLYRSPDLEYEIINNNIKKPINNGEFKNQYEYINMITDKELKYLEIGIENGYGYKLVHFNNKKGVDPDPKYIDDTIYKLTSDQYFEQLKQGTKMDVIFIDGMHQVEYIVRDINNSINILNDNGTIFIDDIIPFNYDEQLKIPKKNYIENNILKYGEPWTGDIWKTIYYILLNNKNDIEYKYYLNNTFRGLLELKIINKFQINQSNIDVINNYSYFDDYPKYLNILCNL